MCSCELLWSKGMSEGAHPPKYDYQTALTGAVLFWATFYGYPQHPSTGCRTGNIRQYLIKTGKDRLKAIKKTVDRYGEKGYNKGRGGEVAKEDEIIGKSLGASAKNYPVRLPDGNHAKFAEGTEITKIKVFAGQGTNNPIREAIYLQETYHQPAESWQKVRGEAIIL